MSTLNRILVSDLVPSVQELHSSTFRSCSGPWRRSPRRRRPSSSTGAPLDRKREYTFLKLIESHSNSSSLVLARFCHAQIPKKKYFFQISLKKILCTVLNDKAEFCLLFLLEFANDKTSLSKSTVNQSKACLWSRFQILPCYEIYRNPILGTFLEENFFSS
jgi:hypothetical protein